MKRIFFLLALSCLFQHVNAQAGDAANNEHYIPFTIIKWNPSSLYFGKIGLMGEYNFKKKKSVTFNIGIPISKTTSVRIDDKDREVEMKTFSVMGGYRMYLGNAAMAGMYFEPYLKYVKSDGSTILDTDLDGKPTNFATTSAYKGFGVGAQLGVQFLIAKRVVIDFFFLGPEANSATHKVVMHDITSTDPWDAQDAADAQAEINSSIGDLPIIGDKLNVVVDPNAKTVSSDYSGFLPGLRFGLSIGVRF
ncbi:DUF3575 domain-containing protein [Flavisolibacter ginsengisoli]|jgi:hypothetical protein|uniref:Outer membrane protein beta-barrel domain-containing protein n=1 Tax=Flavisolibacter ginsengisoli DSM 18119 TaxID=1121884 RepID=A0A1M5EGM6_9BACT|nr:DUF3575 domain-containing protein [Flavisolibacter ginsengisoli]SHF78337.1 hypothetical protein SAMN02745131_03518 [Flavisolibacter ginsengisoli DSM 18119]